MKTFRDIFAANGMDHENTMKRFVGNQGMYLKMLDVFLADSSMGTLKAALGEGDLNGAFEAAHALKGMAGNMGLSRLYEAVCAITEPLRAGESGADYPGLFLAVQGEFEKVRLLREELLAAANLDVADGRPL